MIFWRQNSLSIFLSKWNLLWFYVVVKFLTFSMPILTTKDSFAGNGRYEAKLRSRNLPMICATCPAVCTPSWQRRVADPYSRGLHDGSWSSPPKTFSLSSTRTRSTGFSCTCQNCRVDIRGLQCTISWRTLVACRMLISFTWVIAKLSWAWSEDFPSQVAGQNYLPSIEEFVCFHIIFCQSLWSNDGTLGMMVLESTYKAATAFAGG